MVAKDHKDGERDLLFLVLEIGVSSQM